MRTPAIRQASAIAIAGTETAISMNNSSQSLGPLICWVTELQSGRLPQAQKRSGAGAVTLKCRPGVIGSVNFQKQMHRERREATGGHAWCQRVRPVTWKRRVRFLGLPTARNAPRFNTHITRQRTRRLLARAPLFCELPGGHHPSTLPTPSQFTARWPPALQRGRNVPFFAHA
ncbi:hypothetical protein BU26DRAFT_340429 [Trematosphaeria pertusa]|uniref:Uncharacterized protein n=1 Tax=Trematosphaeria pertusa TaxID=390896 RepID=A0A6A6I8Z4_9PLEO|nr:uncharacterized protein BU26DRAFT_340429 [Trematosphaeria pertusa]KAF2247035.1 hypothetical protein BU26DRAFT_340429 [Trematosphaeria pertusa]